MTEDFQCDCPLEKGIAFQEQGDYKECIAMLTAPDEKFVIEGIRSDLRGTQLGMQQVFISGTLQEIQKHFDGAVA